jgi:alcohol oxidase
VRATKLVLVSAGAFGSPGILERSGIGAKDVLERVGVRQRIDLPGVGENYQGFLCNSHLEHLVLTFGRPCTDHNALSFKYFAAGEAQSMDAILRNEEGAIDGESVFPPSLRGVPTGALRLATILQRQPPCLGRPGRRS